MKRQILRKIKWRDFFDKWFNQESSIIELRGAILDLYPHDHEISDREWRAWKAFIQHAGCTNITPFKKGESKVSKIKTSVFENIRYLFIDYILMFIFSV